MADPKDNNDAEKNAEQVKMVEQNETKARGNVHSEATDEPDVDLPPPLPS